MIFFSLINVDTFNFPGTVMSIPLMVSYDKHINHAF